MITFYLKNNTPLARASELIILETSDSFSLKLLSMTSLTLGRQFDSTSTVTLEAEKNHEKIDNSLIQRRLLNERGMKRHDIVFPLGDVKLK